MNKTKTNHQTGYHKPVVNPTTNYPMDSHKAFCKRCLERYNNGICHITRSGNPSGRCDI